LSNRVVFFDTIFLLAVVAMLNYFPSHSVKT
jgi:hypothetical protein